MSLKKFCAFGIAVVGLAGMVNAQPTMIASPDTVKASTAVMTVDYDVLTYAELTVTPFGLSNNDLTSNPHKTTTVGSLGTIDVRCTFDRWDVTLAFANGGFLTSGGTPGRPADLDQWGNPIPGSAIIAIPGDTLKTVTGSAVPAVKFLEVYGGVYQGGPVGTAVAATQLNGTAVGDSSVISLAKKLGTALNAVNWNGAPVTDIATLGFTSTGENNTAKFFINAGFTMATGEKISGNKPGHYNETVTVTLYGKF